MHEFWKNKRVLVTGHTGFVGSWLSCVLKKMGAEVTGFSLKEDAGSLYGKIKDELGICNVYGDLRDAKAVKSCMEDCNPEIVFHIAAFGFLKECYDDPQRAYASNVQGTLNLFEAIKESSSVKSGIVASSDKVYLNTGLDAYLFTENDSLGGSDTYSASKTCEDMLVRKR